MQMIRKIYERIILKKCFVGYFDEYIYFWLLSHNLKNGRRIPKFFEIGLFDPLSEWMKMYISKFETKMFQESYILIC